MEEQSNRPNALTAEKNKALAAALAHIEKQFGKGSVMRLGDHEVVEDIQVVSTGSLGLEHALDVQYASKLGVAVPDLLISQPDTGEQALEIADALVRSGSVDLIVIDS